MRRNAGRASSGALDQRLSEEEEEEEEEEEKEEEEKKKKKEKNTDFPHNVRTCNILLL